jgi:DNA-binding LytR/AlgR family response regulator
MCVNQSEESLTRERVEKRAKFIIIARDQVIEFKTADSRYTHVTKLEMSSKNRKMQKLTKVNEFFRHCVQFTFQQRESRTTTVNGSEIE